MNRKRIALIGGLVHTIKILVLSTIRDYFTQQGGSEFIHYATLLHKKTSAFAEVRGFPCLFAEKGGLLRYAQ